MTGELFLVAFFCRKLYVLTSTSSDHTIKISIAPSRPMVRTQVLENRLYSKFHSALSVK